MIENIFKKFCTYFAFRKFCKNIFLSNHKKKENIILIEFNSIWSLLIPWAYFISYLSNKYNAKIVAYNNLTLVSKYKLLRYKLSFLLIFNSINFYRIMGVQKFIFFFQNSKKRKKETIQVYKKILKKIKNKHDIENIKIKNVLIGDLIYDHFLKISKNPTINSNDLNFRKYLLMKVEEFLYWDKFISEQIKTIVVSHSVYTKAIPLRICLHRNIEAFQLTNRQIHKLNSKEMFGYTEFKDYKKIFKRLNKKKKTSYINIARKRLEMRFKGAVGVDMAYSKKSAYLNNFYKNRLLKKSDKIKILVPCHCFFDSPHSYGFNLFPDFYEWLNFLGKISEKTNYDWYLKTHPDFKPGNLEILNYFSKKYSKFNILPSDSSHVQIINEGIDVALTVHGTIGCEYPIFNKLVVNASLNNPHIAYNFNLHPKTIGEYKKILLNLQKVKNKFKINNSKSQIYEFYYMHKLFDRKKYFLQDGNSNLVDNLDWFKNRHTKSLDKKILNKFKNFVDSENYYLNL